jgi:hypothetical protein
MNDISGKYRLPVEELLPYYQVRKNLICYHIKNGLNKQVVSVNPDLPSMG